MDKKIPPTGIQDQKTGNADLPAPKPPPVPLYDGEMEDLFDTSRFLLFSPAEQNVADFLRSLGFSPKALVDGVITRMEAENAHVGFNQLNDLSRSVPAIKESASLQERYAQLITLIYEHRAKKEPDKEKDFRDKYLHVVDSRLDGLLDDRLLLTSQDIQVLTARVTPQFRSAFLSLFDTGECPGSGDSPGILVAQALQQSVFLLVLGGVETETKCHFPNG